MEGVERAHNLQGQALVIGFGRFGPYIKHGSTNANVPRGKDPLEVTLEEAVGLIAERIAKGGGKKPAKKAGDEPTAKPSQKSTPASD